MDLWQVLKRVSAGVLRRRKRLVLIAFVSALVVTGTAAYYLSREKPRYGTLATVLIESAPDRIPLFPEFSPWRPLPVQLAILYSRTLAEQVLEKLDRDSVQDLLDNPYFTDYFAYFMDLYQRLRGMPPEPKNEKERSLNELRNGRVRITQTPNPGIVQIFAEASKPRVASDIVNTYVETLLSRTRSFNIDDTRLSREFLEQQVGEVRRNLRGSEEALRSFTMQQGGIRIPDQSQATVARLGQAENALSEVEANRRMLETRLQGLRQKMEEAKKNPPAAAPALPLAQPTSPSVLRLRDQLARLEQSLFDLRMQYTDAHPRVMMVKNRIAELERQLGDQVKETTTVTPDPRLVPAAEQIDFTEQVIALETAQHTALAQEEALRRQSQTLRQSLGNLSRSELEFTRLAREVDSQRNLQGLLSDKLAAARIREQGEMKVVKVIDTAGRPFPTTSDRRIRFAGIAMLLSVGIGLAIPGMVEWILKPVETEDDVEEAVARPVLGLIPRLQSGRPLFVSAGEWDAFDHQPRSVRDSMLFSEMFRALRVAVQLASRGQRLRTLMIASAHPDEGKSTVLMNLGLAFREAGRQVLLADTDFQRPSLHRMLGVADGNGGLADALGADRHHETALSQVSEGLWLAPRGASVQPQTRGLLATSRLKRLLDELADRADLVLCDSSPVLLVPDTLFVASAVDGVILVARAGKTGCRELAQAKAALESAGATVVGVVINGIPASTLKRYYRRYGDYPVTGAA